MPEFSAKKPNSTDILKSSALMQVISSSDEEEGAAKAAESKVDENSESEDGEIDELTELDALRAKGNAEVDAMIEKGLASGGRDVLQKDARYFMIENVVCEHCGVKGHLSFDCKEEQESVRCFLCGKAGHSSKDCPVEVCFYCKETGHRMRECPVRNSGGGGAIGRKRRMRAVLPIRPPKLSCYVCGESDHLDCAIRKDTMAILSCYNCGQQGHAGGGCNMTSVDRVIPIVLEMERERKQLKKGVGERGRKEGKGNGDGEVETDEKEKKGGGADAKLKKMAPKEYREAFLERARKGRYGKRDR